LCVGKDKGKVVSVFRQHTFDMVKWNGGKLHKFATSALDRGKSLAPCYNNFSRLHFVGYCLCLAVFMLAAAKGV
jgi:hypothetical protein